ncbi:hypothetical protein P154DRAFT_577367 [Amniculicola lignicola CBS 123094]|uniref:Uncharacterized protein n=1 Tax=Amniculicola lignicola CBS 123094 TaxID=1392246 RepID=A0A6A5WIL3_9PLEO|nr:hypothetical protein P154DRAFT_577367 [Amniculicola lignicola CBS 123094]
MKFTENRERRTLTSSRTRAKDLVHDHVREHSPLGSAPRPPRYKPAQLTPTDSLTPHDITEKQPPAVRDIKQHNFIQFYLLITAQTLPGMDNLIPLNSLLSGSRKRPPDDDGEGNGSKRIRLTDNSQLPQGTLVVGQHEGFRYVAIPIEAFPTATPTAPTLDGRSEPSYEPPQTIENDRDSVDSSFLDPQLFQPINYGTNQSNDGNFFDEQDMLAYVRSLERVSPSIPADSGFDNPILSGYAQAGEPMNVSDLANPPVNASAEFGEFAVPGSSVQPWEQQGFSGIPQYQDGSAGFGEFAVPDNYAHPGEPSGFSNVFQYQEHVSAGFGDFDVHNNFAPQIGGASGAEPAPIVAVAPNARVGNQVTATSSNTPAGRPKRARKAKRKTLHNPDDDGGGPAADVPHHGVGSPGADAPHDNVGSPGADASHDGGGPAADPFGDNEDEAPAPNIPISKRTGKPVREQNRLRGTPGNQCHWELPGLPNGASYNFTAAEIIAYLPKLARNPEVARRLQFNGINHHIHQRMFVEFRNGIIPTDNTYTQEQRQQAEDRCPNFTVRRQYESAMRKITTPDPGQKPWTNVTTEAFRPGTWDQDHGDDISMDDYIAGRRANRGDRTSKAVPMVDLVMGVANRPTGYDTADLSRAIDFALAHPDRNYLFPDDLPVILHTIGQNAVTAEQTDRAVFGRHPKATGGGALHRQHEGPRRKRTSNQAGLQPDTLQAEDDPNDLAEGVAEDDANQNALQDDVNQNGLQDDNMFSATAAAPRSSRRAHRTVYDHEDQEDPTHADSAVTNAQQGDFAYQSGRNLDSLSERRRGKMKVAYPPEEHNSNPMPGSYYPGAVEYDGSTYQPSMNSYAPFESQGGGMGAAYTPEVWTPATIPGNSYPNNRGRPYQVAPSAPFNASRTMTGPPPSNGYGNQPTPLPPGSNWRLQAQAMASQQEVAGQLVERQERPGTVAGTPAEPQNVRTSGRTQQRQVGQRRSS